ncbi:MAG: hypothetical protein HY242_01905 [Afipia sp.]|nr:hypothetical protein [Afipia sp.]
MAIRIALRDLRTAETRLVKVGWSWTIFFFAWLFGIPLFMRKLVSWGFVFLAMNLIFMLTQPNFENHPASFLWVVTGILQVILIFYLSIKGNELTAKGLLARGWEFVEPQSDITKYAKMRWHIFDNTPSMPSEKASSVTNSAGQA